MSRTPPRIAILGAGPVGLEAALVASSLGLPFTVYERGRVGEHLLRWGHVRMFTPFAANATPAGRAVLHREQPKVKLPGDGDILTGREYVAAYLEPLALADGIAEKVTTGLGVVALGRKGSAKEDAFSDPQRAKQPFRLLLRDTAGKESLAEADVVLDCTGTYDSPRRLGEGGMPALGETAARQHITWGLDDILGEHAPKYADRTTIVVGSGYSAATSVSRLAELAKRHPSTWVIWLAHATGSQPIRRFVSDPLKERDLLAGRANMLATRGEGHVEFVAGARVSAVEQTKDGFVVKGRVGSEERTWEAERLIANVGFAPDSALAAGLAVGLCPSLEAPAKLAAVLHTMSVPGKHVVPPMKGLLSTGEPGYFVLGAKSYGRHRGFFMDAGFAQVREAFSAMGRQ